MLKFFHPCKRNDSGSTNAISNLALSMTSVLSNKINEIFDVKAPATKEDICDKIRAQWMEYQTEKIKDNWFRKSEEDEDECHTPSTSASANNRASYWSQAFQECGLQPKQTYSTNKRIDYFWAKVGSLQNGHGVLKYPQLYALVKTVLSLSHGNACPERGFSINKQMLESHGYVMKEKSIASLRLLKDELHQIGGALKFPCTVELIQTVKGERAKYFADMEQQKLDAEKKKEEKISQQKAKTALESNKIKLDEIVADMERLHSNIQVADAIIQEGNEQLQKVLCTAHQQINRKELQSAQSKIDIGLQRKRKCDKELTLLREKKKLLKN